MVRLIFSIIGGIIGLAFLTVVITAIVIFCQGTKIARADISADLDISEIENIVIDSDFAVKVSSSDTATQAQVKSFGEYKYYGWCDVSGKAEIVDNTLRISIDKNGWLNFPANYDLAKTEFGVDLVLPESYAGNIDITSSLGYSSITATNTFNNVEIDTAAGVFSGSIKASNKAQLNISAGSMQIESVSCKNLITKMSAGEMTVKNIAVANSVESKVSAGQTNLYFANICNMNLNVSAGGIDAYVPQSEDICVDANITAGSIKNNSAFANIDSNISSGKNGNITATFLIEANVSAGGITFHKA